MFWLVFYESSHNYRYTHGLFALFPFSGCCVFGYLYKTFLCGAGANYCTQVRVGGSVYVYYDTEELTHLKVNARQRSNILYTALRQEHLI